MELEKFRDQLFAEGEKLGIEALELYYEKESSLICQVYKGEVDDFRLEDTQGVSVRGIYDGNMGYAYTEKIDEDSISFLLENIKENAILIEDEPEELFAGGLSYENANFYSPALLKVSTEEKIAFLQEVEKKIYAYDPRVVRTDFAIFKDEAKEKALYNSKGLALADQNNFLLLGVSVLVQDGEEIRSGSLEKITKDFSLWNADEIAQEVVEEGLSYLGGKTYPNQTYPVILRNDAAASLIGTFTSSFSAEAVQKNQSLLKDKLHEKIASKLITLVDDPFLYEGIRSQTFDSEGVPTKKLTVVENGKLNTYFHNLKTAKKDAVESTGHGYKPTYKGTIGISASNFYVVPGEETLENMYGDLQESVIITGLQGLHSGANQISGDFSLAAKGYYVKDGKIAGPTNQMTIAGNFFELLQDVVQIGADLKFSSLSTHGWIGSPSLKIKSLSVAVD